ncbi:MAG TPA: dienelactone hydrolase family protein [Rhizomicrobium sp.]|jgi:dienelactone hydrolase
MNIRDIAYDCDGKALTGYLADGSKGGKAPGILLVHQGGGLTEHTKERARMLGELGYVAFALDLYGQVATSMPEAMALIGDLQKDPALLRKRAACGLDVLKAQTNTDTTRLAAIGFCFGGWTVLEMARMDAGLGCVVSFHPGLEGLPETDDRAVTCKVMVCAGDKDPLIPPAARERLIALMNAAKADWQLLTYGRAGHSFTDKTVDAFGIAHFNYDAATDARSWAAMRQLFDETFGGV